MKWSAALFTHELGHVLYTDFLLYQSYHAFLESGKWFPEPPPLRNITERDAEADFLAFQASDPKNRELVALVTHDILNILEDGYIENRMLLDYPGILGSSLEKIRQVQFDDHPSMEDMIEQEADGGHIWQSIHSGLLSYMLWGKLKYGGTLSRTSGSRWSFPSWAIWIGHWSAGMPGTGAGRQT